MISWKTEGRCPYCYRMLPEDFEQKFLESFDDLSVKNLQKLNAFLKSYRDKANALYLHISGLPEKIYPGADEKGCNEKFAVLRDAVSENIDVIKSKIAEPSRKITLAEVALILEDVSEMIAAINEMIRTNNEAYNTKTKKISEYLENLFCHMTYTLQR